MRDRLGFAAEFTAAAEGSEKLTGPSTSGDGHDTDGAHR